MNNVLTIQVRITAEACKDAALDVRAVVEARMREALKLSGGCSPVIDWEEYVEMPELSGELVATPIMYQAGLQGTARAKECESAMFWKQEAEMWKQKALYAIGKDWREK